MSRIQVSIGNLILPHMDSADRTALVEGLRRALTRALSDPAVRAEWAKPQCRSVVRIGPIPLAPGPSDRRRFGSAMGHAIGKGLRP
jgi:hypothetical protein